MNRGQDGLEEARDARRRDRLGAQESLPNKDKGFWCNLLRKQHLSTCRDGDRGREMGRCCAKLWSGAP
jgi:hypothetical protein